MSSYVVDRGTNAETRGDASGPSSSTDNAVARFDGTGGKTLQDSAFVVDDSGHVTSFGGNIAFPATQASSAGANTLDDYEEGSWTPVLAGASTAGTQTYTTQLGRYVKIGLFVFVQCRVAINTKDGTTNGTLAITGLPFTVENVTQNRGAALYASIDLNVAGGYYSPSVTCQPNTTQISLQEQGDNVANAQLTEADFANGSIIDVNACYRATA